METEKYWKIIIGGIDLVNKEHLVKKLMDVKLINNQIDEINLEIFHLINLIENDFARTKDLGFLKNDDEHKRNLFKEYTKKLVSLINKKKTYIFKKKIYSENYN